MKKKDLTELRILQEQLHCLLNKEIHNKLLSLRQREFMGANKPGRFLAWQVKKIRGKKIIAGIRIQNKVITDQDRIKKEFRDFYSDDDNEEKIKNYLVKVNSQKMPEKFKILLNQDISTEVCG